MVTKTIDKHQFKITIALAIAIILFIIAQTASIATWKSDVEHNHEILEKAFIEHDSWGNGEHEEFQDEIDELENRLDDTDVAMPEIKTKLSNIEALLVEIKLDLKTHNKE